MIDVLKQGNRPGGHPAYSGLMPAQIQFFMTLVYYVPYLVPFWDIHTRDLNTHAFDAFLQAVATPNNQEIMGRFMASVWLGANDYNFDITDAAVYLAPHEIAIITQWLNKPFWP